MNNILRYALLTVVVGSAAILTFFGRLSADQFLAVVFTVLGYEFGYRLGRYERKVSPS